MELKSAFKAAYQGKLSSCLHPRVSDPWQNLWEAYEVPRREYHNIGHVRYCIEQCEQQLPGQIATLALFYHDAVCVPGRLDNEYASGDLFSKHFTGSGALGAYTMLRVRDLIMLTRHQEIPRDDTSAMVVDIDMSILGQPPEIFDDYDRAIRLEHKQISDEAYETGRRDFLEKVLGQNSIYYTKVYKDRCEAQARDNIRRRLGFSREALNND